MAAFIAGCSTAQPTIQTGPDAQVSYDGLHLVDNSRLKQAWVDPDIDFTRYNKIMGGGSVFQFRAAKKTPTSTSQRRNLDGEFWISEEDRLRLAEEVRRGDTDYRGCRFDEWRGRLSGHRTTRGPTPGWSGIHVQHGNDLGRGAPPGTRLGNRVARGVGFGPDRIAAPE
jgi:hypothetical protein